MLIRVSADFNIKVNTKDNVGGRSKTVKILMQKSLELNIDLNAKTKRGNTAFHLACYNDHSRDAIAEIC